MVILKKCIIGIISAICFCLLLFLALVLIPMRTLSFDKEISTSTLIRNVSIVDVKNDTILPARNVLVVGQTIKTISTDEIEISGEMRQLDGTGKYLIPAFWDMHVHLMNLSPAIGYPMFIAHGVMHVRDMRGALNNRDLLASDISKVKDWNDLVSKRELMGPMVHSYSTHALEGPHRMYRSLPDYFNCATPQDAIKLVRHFKESGYNQIKVYNNLSRDSFFALAKEAQIQGMEIVGHKPFRITAIEASNAGMKSLEHGKFLIWESTPKRDEIINHPNPGSLDNTGFRRQLLDEHDPELLKEIFDTFVVNQTYYCPTLLTRKADAFADGPDFRKNYDQVNFIFRFLAFEDLDQTISEDPTAFGRNTYVDFYKKSLEVTYEAYINGVKILAGTDVPELPGSSLHEELEELSFAGIPNFEVLRTATLYPAQYYNLESLYGSIEEGKLANLILLNENPITSISNTKEIHSLFIKGDYIDENKRKSILAQTNKLSKSLTATANLIWAMILFLTI